MTSTTRLARTAGLYYLVVAVLGAFAHIVRAQVYRAGDAAATTAKIQESTDLVRFSFVADLVQATFLVFTVLALHRLLRHVDTNLARAMVVFVAVAVAITSLNLVHQLGAILVVADPAYAAAFGVDGSEALVLLLMDLQHYGYLIAQIFFGLWLFPLGMLAWRSGMFPRLISVLLVGASICYLLDVVLQFLAPSAADVVNPVLITLFSVAEGSMLLFLLIKGVLTSGSVSRERVLV